MTLFERGWIECWKRCYDCGQASINCVCTNSPHAKQSYDAGPESGLEQAMISQEERFLLRTIQRIAQLSSHNGLTDAIMDRIHAICDATLSTYPKEVQASIRATITDRMEDNE